MLTLSQAEGLSQIYQWRAGGLPQTSWTGRFERIMETAKCRDLLPVHVSSNNGTGRDFDVVAMTGLQTPPTETGEEPEVESFIKRISSVEIQMSNDL